jgi:hypothetical protein
MTLTAIEWYRHHIDTMPTVPDTPVGPDLANGLSQSFYDDAFDALGLVTLSEVEIMLTYGDRGPLPPLSTVELTAETQCINDLAQWPNYTDDLRMEWLLIAGVA